MIQRFDMNGVTIHELYIIKTKFNIDIVLLMNQLKKLHFISDFEMKKILKGGHAVNLFAEN